MPDAVVGQRVHHRVHHRGQRAGAAGLAAALDAERIGLGRHRMCADRERRHVGGARQRIVHVGAGEELAFGIVDRHLHQGLADALHGAAMQLALDDHRIDDGAEIVDAGIFHHRDHAGIGIDLDLGDMAAVGEGGGGALAHMAHVERGRHAFRQVDPAADLLGQVHDADGAIGAGDDEAAVLELDVGGGRFQHVRRDLAALLDHLGGGLHDRGAARHDGFGAAAAAAQEETVAVALQQADLLERNAELLAQHLRERGGMAHAEIHGAGQQRDAAVGLEDDAAHLLGGRGGDLEEIADAEPAQLAALAAFALAPRKALEVGGLDRLPQYARKIAAVIGHAGGGFVGDMAPLDLVAPAQLQPVDVELGGGGVDQPLHVVVAFRPAGAPIGRHVAGIGEHALGRDLDQRRAIDVLHVLDRVEGRGHRPDIGQEGAHVSEAREPHRQELAVGVERELGRDPVVAAMAVGYEAARALVGPLHRHPERARRMQRADIFGIDRGLHAERAADIAGDDMDLGRLDAHHLGHHAAHPHHALGGRIKRKAPVLVLRQRGARLHRIDHDAVVDEPQPRHMGGPPERLRHQRAVAIVIVERDIVGDVIVEKRRARPHRLLRIGDGGEGIDIDLDRLGGILGLQQGLRHHAGDRIADEAHLVGRQRRPRWLVHGRAVAVVERHDALECPVAGGGEIGPRIDAEHARHRPRGCRVDRANEPMGVAAAHHHRMGLTGDADIVGKAALAADQLGILATQHRLANSEFCDRPTI